jgi:hypothetical protein
MKYLKVRHYINVLFREGTEWEYKELLPSSDTQPISRRKYSWRKRGVLLLPSCIIFYFLKTGFSNDFMNYVIYALAIFIGLFTNLIVVLYQRYSTITPKIETEQTSHLAMLNNRKMKNFIRQFTFVTGKNLLIATAIIVLISIFMLFQSLAKFYVINYRFVEHVSEINYQSIVFFLKGCLSTTIRMIIIYALIDFTILLLYSLGSLFAFLK